MGKKRKAPEALVIYPGERACGLSVTVEIADDALRAVHSAGALDQEGPAAVAAWRHAQALLASASRCAARQAQILEAPVVVEHIPAWECGPRLTQLEMFDAKTSV